MWSYRVSSGVIPAWAVQIMRLSVCQGRLLRRGEGIAGLLKVGPGQNSTRGSLERKRAEEIKTNPGPAGRATWIPVQITEKRFYCTSV